MTCKKCNSERVLHILAHASDMFVWSMGGEEEQGYLPLDFGLGGGDDLDMNFCLNCGQVQESRKLHFPLPTTDFELGEEEE